MHRVALRMAAQRGHERLERARLERARLASAARLVGGGAQVAQRGAAARRDALALACYNARGEGCG